MEKGKRRVSQIHVGGGRQKALRRQDNAYRSPQSTPLAAHSTVLSASAAPIVQDTPVSLCAAACFTHPLGVGHGDDALPLKESGQDDSASACDIAATPDPVLATLDNLLDPTLEHIARLVPAYMHPILSRVSHRWRYVVDATRPCGARPQRDGDDTRVTVLPDLFGTWTIFRREPPPRQTIDERTVAFIDALVGARQLGLLQWAHEQEGMPLPPDMCDKAVEHGDRDLLRWLCEKGFTLSAPLCARAASLGDRTTIEWLRAAGCPWDESTLANAAGQGHLELIKWLDASACPWSREALDQAASRGHLPVLMWMHRERRPADERPAPDAGTCAAAAHGNRINVLVWLQFMGCPWDADTCAYAASAGHLRVIEWARHRECPWDARVCCGAARGGHLDVLKWAVEHGCPWPNNVLMCAAAGNHIEVLRWAQSQRGPLCDVRITAAAAAGGHLGLLRWLNTQGCPWDATACESAAQYGHLDVLQWLRIHGCPWDKRVCEVAAFYGHAAVLEWASERGCPWDKETCAQAARGRHHDILEWAHAHGCPLSASACTEAAGEGNWDAVRWARDRGCSLDGSVHLHAAEQGRLLMLAWAHGEQCRWDRFGCRNAAERAGHAHIVEWIDALPPRTQPIQLMTAIAPGRVPSDILVSAVNALDTLAMRRVWDMLRWLLP